MAAAKPFGVAAPAPGLGAGLPRAFARLASLSSRRRRLLVTLGTRYISSRFAEEVVAGFLDRISQNSEVIWREVHPRHASDSRNDCRPDRGRTRDRRSSDYPCLEREDIPQALRSMASRRARSRPSRRAGANQDPRLPVSVTQRADPVFRRHSHGMLNSWNLHPIGTSTFVGKPKADAGMNTPRQPRCIPVAPPVLSLIRPNYFPDMPELFPCYAPVIFPAPSRRSFSKPRKTKAFLAV